MRHSLVVGLLSVALLSACATEQELNSRAGIKVEQADKNVRIILPNSTLFNTDEAVILPASDAALKRTAVLLKRTASNISIEGHTDNQGSLEYNQTLSEKRAKVVEKRLAELGTPADRLSSKGFSYNQPVASNDTAEGRAKNRRTDVVVVNETLEKIMGR